MMQITHFFDGKEMGKETVVKSKRGDDSPSTCRTISATEQSGRNRKHTSSPPTRTSVDFTIHAHEHGSRTMQAGSCGGWREFLHLCDNPNINGIGGQIDSARSRLLFEAEGMIRRSGILESEQCLALGCGGWRELL